jgi:hypothetical protein
MLSVSATEFSENFGRYQEAARREPVAVVSDGLTSGYFIGTAEFEAYERLKTLARKAYAVECPPEEVPTRESAGAADAGAATRPETLADIARRLFGTEGGVELELPPRGLGREPPSFG